MSSSPPPMQVIPITPSYAVPDTQQRPGGITVVGVISIILAIFGMIANASTAGFSGMTLVAAKLQQMSASLQDATRFPLQSAASVNSPHGLNDFKAQAVVEGLNSTRPLSPQRQQHVKALALMYGQKLFVFAADSFTASRVRANITDSGPVLLGGGQAGDFYLTSTGRIEVSNSSAIFRSDDGEVFRSGDVTSDDSLTEAEIDAVIAQFPSHSVTPNASQEATIQRLLRDPAQQIFSKADPNFPAHAITLAGPLEQGGIWFLTIQAQVRIDSSGAEMLLSNQAPIPGENPFTGKQIRMVWGQMLLIECLASGLLTILLLIAGIMLLRGRPIGRKLHLVFALIKLPLAIAGAALLGLTVAEWMGALAAAPSSGPPPVVASALMTGILVGFAGLIWPVIVLAVMTRKRVKDYFNGVV